nr:MAG TPA: hypothetical protein [Caudoviricetes sp.]
MNWSRQFKEYRIYAVLQRFFNGFNSHLLHDMKTLGMKPRTA